MPVADAAREGPAHAEIEEAAADLSFKRGTGFAVSVVGIMLAEQTLMNAGVLIVAANAGSKAGLTVGITGFVFNVLLIVRAPLQLFQAIQTSILPHLASLEVRESAAEFHQAIRTTIKVIAAFAGAVAIGLLAIGPFVMTALLGDKGFHYGRFGLALVGLGMGLHLTAGTLNQAALARGRAPLAAVAWLTSAALFVAFMLSDAISNQVTRVEVSYFTATLILCGLLWAIYRRGSAPVRAGGAPAAPAPSASPLSASARVAEALAGGLAARGLLDVGIAEPARVDLVQRRARRSRRAPAPRSGTTAGSRSAARPTWSPRPHRVPELRERLDDRPRHRLAVRDVRRARGLDPGQRVVGVLLDRSQEALEVLLGLRGARRGRVVERAAPGHDVLLERRDRRAHRARRRCSALTFEESARSTPRAQRRREQHGES